MRRAVQREMEVIRDLAEIPVFANETEEAHFWGTHTFSPEILARFDSIPDDVLPTRRPRTRPVVIRLEHEALDVLKQLAAQRHRRYQTLLREFVLERLREEQRCQGGADLTTHVPTEELRSLAQRIADEEDPRLQSELASKLLKATTALRQSKGV